jgi:hypothetical protein
MRPKSSEHRQKISESVRRVLSAPEMRQRISEGARKGRAMRDARTCIYCNLRDYRVLIPDGTDAWACANQESCEQRILQKDEAVA